MIKLSFQFFIVLFSREHKVEYDDYLIFYLSVLYCFIHKAERKHNNQDDTGELFSSLLFYSKTFGPQKQRGGMERKNDLAE